MVAAAGPTLRIVFFGTPDFAVPSLERLIASRHPIAGVVTRPDRPRGRGQRPCDSPVKALARRHDLRILQPERLKDEAFLRALADLGADLGIVAAYGKILTDRILATPRLGMINVHASLLPKYRGAAPVHRAIIAGERETGVTIMRVVGELDAGPLLAREVRPIGPDETSDALERDLAALGADLLVRAVEDLAAGRARETPQDAARATYAHRLTKAEGLIDWSLPARDIHNRVRGLHPWPHAYTHLGGDRFIVLRTAVDEDDGSHAIGRDRRAGEVFEASPRAFRVAAGAGSSLRILDIQPEGRRPMAAREFLAGHRLTAGAVFGKPS